MSHAAITLCKKLMAKASVTPDDMGCQQLMADELKKAGFDITPYHKNGVSNLWAKRGHTKPLVVFAGHTDVVPTGPLDAWQSPPFTPTEKNGLLYGRGAADMKASLAAFVVAIQDFVSHYPEHSGSIGVLLTSDEEGPAQYGTKHVIEQLQAKQEHIDYCIVGEPSSHLALGDTIRVGRRGSLHATLSIQGKQGHVAYPDLARNPIHLFAPALQALCETRWDEGDDVFPPTSFQCSNLVSGTGANNVIPDTLTLTCNFRFAPCSSVDSLTKRFETILKTHQLNYTVDWHTSALPFYAKPGKLRLATHQVLTQVMGKPPENSTSGGTSDARFIAPLGTEVIELGPINATIHQIDECVAIDDITQLTKIYGSILKELLVLSTD